jgi:hypothetical protein
METNENAKKEQYQAAEQELIKLLERVEGIEEGNLKEAEEEILEGVLKIGKRILEGKMSKIEEPIEMKKKGECGHEQKLVGYRPKKLLTMFGEVGYKRAYYQCQMEEGDKRDEERCSNGRAPSDEKWGVSGTRTTPGVQRLVSYYSSMLTYEEAAEAFSRVLPLGISARQVLNLVKPVGKALAEEEDKHVKELFDEAMKKHSSEKEEREQDPIERLYIEADGIMERMRRGSVPMKDDEKKHEGDVYREVKVGAVFEAERGRERSELVPDIFIDTPKKDSTRYVARRTTSENFGRLLYALAHQAGLKRAKLVVFLGDGAHWIWNMAAEHFPTAIQIVDLYHAKEHVWEVAHAAQPGTDWNAERMRYPQFRAQGLQIGSGVAEAACKTVVAARFKRSGMRWTPQGLDAALPLRAAKLSGTYDLFWQDRQRLVA